MADNVQIIPVGFRILDDSGDPVAGGKMKFYDAGTSTPRTVYTDADLTANGATVFYADSSGVIQTSDGSGVDAALYTGTTDYKVDITDASDNSLIVIDNLAGAVDTSSYLTVATPYTMAVTSKTSAYTTTSNDNGTVINCDASGGAFTITLGDGTAGSGHAASVGDGATITIRKTDSSANAVTVDGYSSETINGELTWNLTEQNDSIFIVCDGSNWHTIAKGNETGTSDVLATDATYRTISTTITVDDSIPQSSEGDTVDTIAITPSTSSSQIQLSFDLWGVSSTNMQVVASIFKDSETSARWAKVVDAPNGEYTEISGHFVDSPATTSSVTYTLRLSVTTGTFDLLGSTSARLMGGVATTTFIAKEF